MQEATDEVMLDNIRASALTEVGNILLNGVMGSLTNLLNADVRFRVPRYSESQVAEMVRLSQATHLEQTTLAARTRLAVKERAIEGHVHLIFAMEAFGALLLAIDSAYAI